MTDRASAHAAEPSAEELKVELSDGVCLLTLNRASRSNALSASLGEKIRGAVLAADANSAVSVIAVTGAGPAFCAGADLKDAAANDAAGVSFASPLHKPERSTFEVLIDSRKPSIAIVNGPATAGGFELALACDLRVAVDSAWFSVPEAKRGMGAHLASVLLPQMVPPGIAMEWLYTGRRIELEEAVRWGLVNRVVPAGQLLAAARELALDIAGSAPLSLQRLKLTYRKTAGLPLHSALRLDAGPDVYTSEDRKEGARAFLEKRRPVWTGR